MGRVFNAIRHPAKILLHIADYGVLDWVSDEAYLKIIYRCEMGRKLNLSHPTTYNEKLQWLKLYDHRPEYIIYSDKYAVREYYKQTLGDEYLVPLIAVYDKVDDIQWDELPNQFILKCTHASGTNIICQDKNKLDIEESKRQLNRWLKMNYYWHGREWPYKSIKPRIICEELLTNENEQELKDYKFMCFNGVPKCLFVCLNRYSSNGMNVDFYDMDWNPMPFIRHYPRSGCLIDKPQNFELMVEIAKILSKNLIFLRVDFYEANGHLYLGELTFYPGSGFAEFTPESYDALLGSWIELPIDSTH